MIEYRTFTLDNGLRVVHNCDPQTAMVAVNVLYDTGARDESPRQTGIAHLFEHLMFGGSANVTDYSAALEAAGGSDNAWTSNDYTNFYDIVPAHNVETAFWLESDRLLSPALSERTVAVQRQVVIEEFKQQCLNRPYGNLGHHLRRLLYGENNPYGWPVIGRSPEHVASVTADDARRWFYSHYGPEKAVVAVSGNISFDRVVELAEKWFGPIERRTAEPRPALHPAFPTSDIVERVTGAVPQTAVTIAFPMAAYGNPEYFIADSLTDILAAGKSSRLYRRLVVGGDGLFTDADASIAGSECEGFLMLNVRLSDNSDEAVDRARRIMLDEVRQLCEPGNISRRELERSLNRFESTFNFSNMGYQAKAASLAMAVMHGEDVNDTVERQRRLVSVESAMTTARDIFARPSVTVVYAPE